MKLQVHPSQWVRNCQPVRCRSAHWTRPVSSCPRARYCRWARCYPLVQILPGRLSQPVPSFQPMCCCPPVRYYRRGPSYPLVPGPVYRLVRPAGLEHRW
jgi:hypothetical protein